MRFVAEISSKQLALSPRHAGAFDIQTQAFRAKDAQRCGHRQWRMLTLAAENCERSGPFMFVCPMKPIFPGRRAWRVPEGCCCRAAVGALLSDRRASAGVECRQLGLLGVNALRSRR